MSNGPEDAWHELLRRLPWQGELLLEQFATMPRGGGVYMVHATVEGARAKISRARAVDADGVLLIGESEDLASRGRTLAAAMRWTGGTKTAPSHRPGLEYSSGWGYDFGRTFPLEGLRLRYVSTDAHELLEAGLLERYRWEFLDRPPLNSSNGNWRNQERTETGWLKLDF